MTRCWTHVVRSAAAALATVATLSACGGDAGPAEDAPNTGEVSATSTPAGGEGGVTEIAQELEKAYVTLPLGSQLSYEDYQALYAPIWARAEELGYTLTRMPVQVADGFSLPSSEATQPGHALLTELTGDGVRVCIAASDAVDISALNPDQADKAKSGTRTFLVLDGGCEVHVAYLSSL